MIMKTPLSSSSSYGCKIFELRIIRELRKNSLPYIINNWRKRKYKKIQNIVSKENNKKVLNDC